MLALVGGLDEREGTPGWRESDQGDGWGHLARARGEGVGGLGGTAAEGAGPTPGPQEGGAGAGGEAFAGRGFEQKFVVDDATGAFDDGGGKDGAVVGGEVGLEPLEALRRRYEGGPGGEAETEVLEGVIEAFGGCSEGRRGLGAFGGFGVQQSEEREGLGGDQDGAGVAEGGGAVAAQGGEDLPGTGGDGDPLCDGRGRGGPCGGGGHRGIIGRGRERSPKASGVAA